MKYNQHIQVRTCSSTVQNKATEENKLAPAQIQPSDTKNDPDSAVVWSIISIPHNKSQNDLGIVLLDVVLGVVELKLHNK